MEEILQAVLQILAVMVVVLAAVVVSILSVEGNSQALLDEDFHYLHAPNVSRWLHDGGKCSRAAASVVTPWHRSERQTTL